MSYDTMYMKHLEHATPLGQTAGWGQVGDGNLPFNGCGFYFGEVDTFVTRLPRWLPSVVVYLRAVDCML